jgi:hypothetical protein
VSGSLEIEADPARDAAIEQDLHVPVSSIGSIRS